jgi:uncharacterized membrane protein YqjE
MPEPDVESRRPGSGTVGLGGMTAGILGTVIDYLHARVALLGLEAREARSAILFRIICGVAGGFFLMVTWIALIVGAVGWLAESRGWPWPLVAVGCAVIHLGAALALLLAARRRFAESPFRDSLNELEKDRQWLKRHRPEN